MFMKFVNSLCNYALVFAVTLFATTASLSFVIAHCVKADTITNTKPANAATVGNDAAFDNLPLSFEINQGQADEAVKFLAQAKGYRIALTAQGVLFAPST